MLLFMHVQSHSAYDNSKPIRETYVFFLGQSIIAYASAEHSAPASSDQSMTIVLSLIVMVATAYLLAHFVVEFLQRRWLFVSGAEYIILGIGLAAIGVLPDPERYTTAVVFAIGWASIDFGLNTNLRQMLSQPGYETRIAVVDSLCTIACCSIGTAMLFYIMSGSTDYHWDSAIVIGCIAGTGSHGAIEVVQNRFPNIQTRILPTLSSASSLSNVITIAAFTAAVCLFHSDATGVLEASPSTWGWITIGVGIGLGLLFSAFLSGESNENAKFLAVTGIICFAAGAAYYLDLSIVGVLALLGLVLGSTAHGSELQPVMKGARQPVTILLLAFAGLFWSTTDFTLVVIGSIAYFSLRLIGKILGSWLSSSGTSLRSDLFRGTMAQGPLAIAMALSMRLMFEGEFIAISYDVALIVIAINEVLSARMLRGLLVDAGEIREDLQTRRGA